MQRRTWASAYLSILQTINQTARFKSRANLGHVVFCKPPCKKGTGPVRARRGYASPSARAGCNHPWLSICICFENHLHRHCKTSRRSCTTIAHRLAALHIKLVECGLLMFCLNNNFLDFDRKLSKIIHQFSKKICPPWRTIREM